MRGRSYYPLLGKLYAAVVLSIAVFLTVKACLQFARWDWDYMAYHLPDVLRRVKLTTFDERPSKWIVNQTFPPLPHYVQGLLVRLAGRMSFANSHNALALLLLTVAMHRMFRPVFSPVWFLTGCFSVPLIVTHFTSGYIDLFTGSFITLAFISLVYFEKRLDNGDPPAEALRAALPWMAIGFCGGMLSKYHAWPILTFLYLFLMVWLFRVFRAGALSGRELSLTAFALAAFIAIWPVRNHIVFGNPVYPYRPPLFASSFQSYFQNGEGRPEDIPKYLRNSTTWVRFLHSSLELNRLVGALPFKWTVAQLHEPAWKNPHNRMGGWFYCTVLAFCAVLPYLALRRYVPRRTMLALLLLVPITAILPQSHELRYWLFLPLVACFYLGLGIRNVPGLTGSTIRTSFAFLAVLVLCAAGSWTIDTRDASSYASSPARQFWRYASAVRMKEPLLLCGRYNGAIFWAGPTFNEFPVENCE